jgi:hypothetical protein
MTLRVAVATALVLAAAALLARRAGDRTRARPRATTARPIRVLPPDSTIAGRVETEHAVGPWKVRLIADTVAGEKVAEVSKGGHRVTAVRAVSVRLEFVGRDITGDHVPDVVIEAFTGGAHCCTQALVLGLGDTLTDYGLIDGADGEIEFEDLNGDSIPEVRVGDWRFAYWRDYPFVETEVPEVVLRFQHGAYRAACDLMREDAPDERTLRQRARTLASGWVGGDPPPALYGYAVDLVYAGHADLAWRFLDLAWPAQIAGKDDFVRDLQDRLTGSACWSPPPAERRVT